MNGISSFRKQDIVFDTEKAQQELERKQDLDSETNSDPNEALGSSPIRY